MAFRSASLRNNLLGNNENAHKATKEVAKIVSGPTLRRAVLGDRSNLQKVAVDAKKIKSNIEPFKKPVTTKPKPAKKTSKKEDGKPSECPPDASMTSLCTTANLTTDHVQSTTFNEDMSVQADSINLTEEKDTIDNDVEELVESFSSKLLTVDDIDAEDRDNPQLVSIYVNEIYAYMRSLEEQHMVRKHYLEGASVTPRMRSILVDWLVQVHIRFNLMQETLFLSIAMLDRYLQVKPNTSKEKLQLVGVTAMFIASKYEEMYCTEINDFVFITDKAYTKRQIREMEVDMLRTLKFYISYPLPLHFLRRNSKAGMVDGGQHTLAKYLIELCLPDYALSHFKASEIGAAALNLTLKLLGDNPNWTDTLVYYSGYTEAEIAPVVCKMAQCVTRSHNSRQQAIQQKYQSSKYMKISELPQLKGMLIRQLSEKAASYT